MLPAQSLYQTVHRAGSKPKERPGKGSYGYHLPHDVQDQTSQGKSWLSDSAGPLFVTYLKISEEQEQRRAEQLKMDTDQLLVFCGLFSATVSPLIVTSIPYLSSETGSYEDGKTWRYDPQGYLIWANSLWFLSVLISLTCALAAMVLQHWTRRHLPYYNVHKEARMRAFFTDGRATLDFPVIVASITVLVHISVLLFFVGVLIYMIHVNNTIFKIALIWIALCILVYVGITLLPVFRPDTPFRTPFSNLVLFIRAAILRCSNVIIRLTTRDGSDLYQKGHSCGWKPWNLVNLAEERVMNQFSKIDGTVLKQTLDTVRDDHDLEQFFDAIPGFFASEMTGEPCDILDVLGRENLVEALVGFLDRTFSSNLVSESVKGQRLIICMKVIKAAELTIAVPSILRVLFFRGVGGILRAPEVRYSLGNLRNNKDTTLLARVIISGIISNAERDDYWRTLVMDELGISKDVLQRYLEYGDSVLLANLVHITHHLYHSLLDDNRNPSLPVARESPSILPLFSEFDIPTTLPELQHHFCNLRDSIDQQAQESRVERVPFTDEIRRLHSALPQITAVGENADHQPNSTPPMPQAAVRTAHHIPAISSTHLSVSKLPHIGVADVPTRVSSESLTSPRSQYSSPSQRQSPPTISPVAGTSAMQGITNTSSDSSIGIGKPSVRSSSGTKDALRPGKGTTGTQTERNRTISRSC